MRVYGTQESTVSAEDSGVELQANLTAAKSLAEASDLVRKALIRKLVRARMIEVEDVDASRPANSYGGDSLVAVEVRAWVLKEVRSDVSVFDILSNSPLTTLAAKIAAKSSLISVSVQMEEM